jgi:hypothetical protein
MLLQFILLQSILRIFMTLTHARRVFVVRWKLNHFYRSFSMPKRFLLMLMLVVLTVGAAAAQDSRRAQVVQWASDVVASSQFGDESWSAEQALGAPDVFACEDNVSAWASAESTGEDTLTLFYEKPVVPTQINIFQTFTPGSITAVDLIPAEGDDLITIDNSADPGTDCPGVFSINLPEDLPEVMGVVIYLDQSIGGSWNEIDAVELVGLVAGDPSKSMETSIESGDFDEYAVTSSDSDSGSNDREPQQSDNDAQTAAWADTGLQVEYPDGWDADTQSDDAPLVLSDNGIFIYFYEPRRADSAEDLLEDLIADNADAFEFGDIETTDLFDGEALRVDYTDGDYSGFSLALEYDGQMLLIDALVEGDNLSRGDEADILDILSTLQPADNNTQSSSNNNNSSSNNDYDGEWGTQFTCDDGTEIVNGLDLTIIQQRPGSTYIVTVVGIDGFDPVLAVRDAADNHLCNDDDSRGATYSANLPTTGQVDAANTSSQVIFSNNASDLADITINVGGFGGTGGEFVVIVEGMVATDADGAGDPFSLYLSPALLESGVIPTAYNISVTTDFDPVITLIDADYNIMEDDAGDLVFCDDAGNSDLCWGESENLERSFVSRSQERQVPGGSLDAMLALPLGGAWGGYYNFAMTGNESFGDYVAVFHLGTAEE